MWKQQKKWKNTKLETEQIKKNNFSVICALFAYLKIEEEKRNRTSFMCLVQLHLQLSLI